jgi:hypothetical protein
MTFRTLHDLLGQRFGRLTVIGRAENSRSNHARWNCSCSCGGGTVAYGIDLKSGHTYSCGCLRSETIAKSFRTHGRSRTPTYVSYSGAKNRCTNPNEPGFPNYGGRGIKFLYTSFEQFFAELGERPEGMSLERIDNDGHYGPGNCRWATRLQQANNTRRNRKVTAFGRTRTIAWWSRETGVPQVAIFKRLQAGWSSERALRRGDHRHKRSQAGKFKWPRWPRRHRNGPLARALDLLDEAKP